MHITPLRIKADPVWLDAELAFAPQSAALVLLIGCAAPDTPGGQRLADTAQVLQARGLATLCLSLLSHGEHRHVSDADYNMPLLARRILAAREWIAHQPQLAFLPLGLLADGSAAGAAIRAMVEAEPPFAALVCRAGRPDLAGAGPLGKLLQPTLFISAEGGTSTDLMAQAYRRLSAPASWCSIANADDDFSAAGSLEASARAAADWLHQQLLPTPPQNQGA